MKKIILSGIQPSGALTIGNYVGAVRNWAKLQTDETYCFYCVADMHAITVRQDPNELRKRSFETAALLLAAGIDPDKSTLFIQSQVPQHAQLSWVLCCNSYMGELSRMTQFKDKSATKNEENINAGLFTYPVLMAADILLYNADYVPVGVDQKQHLELCRDIAIRFNNAYGEVFKVPEPMIARVGAKIMSLQSPDKKMSKSDPNPNGFVAIMDEPDVIMKKFKRAVTDSESVIEYREDKLGVSNLLTIYATITGKSIEESVAEFQGMGYGQLKIKVAEAVIEELTPIQTAFKQYLANPDYISEVLEKGRKQASEAAQKILDKVFENIGF
jgi:tryptophanyl-tRNA synthetase